MQGSADMVHEEDWLTPAVQERFRALCAWILARLVSKTAWALSLLCLLCSATKSLYVYLCTGGGVERRGGGRESAAHERRTTGWCGGRLGVVRAAAGGRQLYHVQTHVCFSSAASCLHWRWATGAAFTTARARRTEAIFIISARAGLGGLNSKGERGW